ncbi:lamin tail domain-containing protein [bacterium SCSIO 12741]|nr:lamin tail domain-containing protein [bacterium SCSIO 12741]
MAKVRIVTFVRINSMSLTRILLFGVLLLISFSGISQVQDDFRDGDFTNNPTWVGDTAKFRVNTAMELQLFDTSKSSPAYLVTPSKAIYKASWEFKFRLDFAPSSNNYALAYLGAQKQDLSSSPDGYYVRLGGVGGSADDFSLYKRSGSTNTKIIDGKDSLAAFAPSGWIKVTRDSAGNWELLVDTSSTRSGYVSQGTVFDNDHLLSEYFGFYCRYTTTRSELFFFDSVNVTGSYYQDTTKPVVQAIQLLSDQAIDVVFSENVDPTTAQSVNNYQVTLGIGNPSSAQIDATDSSLVHLQFASSFPSGVQHQIIISGVADRNGNVMGTHQEPFTWITYDPLTPGDVVINEIFADPSPPVALPEKEFVELLNLTGKTFNLQDVTFSDPSKTATIGNYILDPNEYVILCSSSDSSLFAPYGKVIAVTNFPSLNNSGDVLTLADKNGVTIDEVAYTDSWYGDPDKEDGGFTLELIHPNNPCGGGSANWSGSNDVDGGTPGRKNSVYDTVPPTTRPVITSVQVTLPYELQLSFSGPMDSASLINATYHLTPNNNSVIQVLVPSNPSQSARVKLFTSLEVGVVNYLSISGATDCYGNLITSDSVAFGRGALPGSYDIVIHELYPDPDESKSSLPEYEFIELYNTTDKLINLISCTISDPSTSASLDGLTILPKGYLILCDEAAVSEYRSYGETVGLKDWPSLNNSGDDLVLARGNLTIHEVSYSSEWYGDESKKDGGWTLEMVDDANPCGEANNWRASIDEEGGTPGKVNSIRTSNPDETAPEIVRGGAIEEKRLFIQFNEAVSTTDLDDIQIKASPRILMDSLYFTDRKTLEITLHSALTLSRFIP